jgi:hypothetical protein
MEHMERRLYMFEPITSAHIHNFLLDLSFKIDVTIQNLIFLSSKKTWYPLPNDSFSFTYYLTIINQMYIRGLVLIC